MYPVLFYIAGIPVKSYHAFMLLGLAAFFITLHLNLGKTTEKRYKTAFLFALLSIIPFIAGALLGYAVEVLITKNPAPEYGTASLWWGMAAAAACSFYIAKKLKTNVWEAGDLFAPSIAIGGFFIRLGCFLNGCCHGRSCPADFPFPAYMPASLASLGINEKIYPSQLFESLCWAVIFILLSYNTGKPGFKGRKILLLFIFYPCARFIIDLFRFYPDHTTLAISRIWAVLAFSIALIAYIVKQKQK